MKATALAIIIAFRAGCTSEVIANDQAIPRVAFFWLSANQHVTSIDDSGRGAADTVVGRHVPATSGRFQLIPVPPDLDDAIAAAPIANCNGCERDFALKAGADLAAWGTVQKVSNLILNINVYIEDAKAKKMLFAKSCQRERFKTDRVLWREQPGATKLSMKFALNCRSWKLP